MDDSQAVDPRLRWWAAMKRAFHVPEREPDGNAQAAIVRAVIRDSGGFFDIDEIVAGSAMVDATLDLASAGELDRLLTIDESLYPSGAMGGLDAAYNHARNLGWPDVTDQHTLLNLREVSDHLIGKVINSEREGPPRSP